MRRQVSLRFSSIIILLLLSSTALSGCLSAGGGPVDLFVANQENETRSVSVTIYAENGEEQFQRNVSVGPRGTTSANAVVPSGEYRVVASSQGFQSEFFYEPVDCESGEIAVTLDPGGVLIIEQKTC